MLHPETFSSARDSARWSPRSPPGPPAAHLVEPLPLERNGEFEEKCNDPGEVYVTYDLWGGGRKKK